MKQNWLDELRAIEKSRNSQGVLSLYNYIRMIDILRMLQMCFGMGIGEIERYAKQK